MDGYRSRSYHAPKKLTEAPFGFLSTTVVRDDGALLISGEIATEYQAKKVEKYGNPYKQSAHVEIHIFPTWEDFIMYKKLKNVQQ